MGRLQTAIMAPGFVLTYPATLAHELTHLAAAAPWSDSVGYNPLKTYLEIEWTEAAPVPAQRFAAIAPTVVGVAFLLAAVVSVGTGFWTPRERTIIEYSIIGAYWIQYTWPSVSDRAGLLDATPRGERP